MGRESSFEKDPSPEDWARLYTMAKHQALLGVLNAGVHRLPPAQQPPEHILAEWDRLAGKIKDIHARHEKQVAELAGILERMGLKGCVLKGTGLARLYPDPGRRQCGDIDVWVPGPRRSLLEAFSKEYNVHDVIYQECKVDIFDNTVVELHFHPTKMYNPFCNARLQRWFDKHCPIGSASAIPCRTPDYESGGLPAQGLHSGCGEGSHAHQVSPSPALCYPDAAFNAVFCMAHMYRHYLSGGLGLRQMMDYYYVLRKLPAAERDRAMQALKRLGMGRFAAATMLALRFNFGLEDEYLLCKPDMKRGPKLINDMIKMGNFGILDPRNIGREGESMLGRFRRKNRRAFSNLRDYPREILWSPLHRIGQFLWRLLHGYL